MKLYEKELGEFVENISDTEKINKDEVILVNTSDVENGKVINHNYVKNSNLKGQFKKRFKRNDILYSEIRPKNKRFAYIDFDSEDYIASTKLMVLRNKGNIDNEYLYQILKSDYVINYLQHIAEARSGTFPQITFNELARTKIMIPDQENQKKIAYILNSIDKKIKLNTHTNNNLFEIGDAIYIANINRYNNSKLPKDWKTKTLKEVTNNFDFKRKPMSSRERIEHKGKYPYYGATSIIDYVDDFIFDNTYILMGEDGTVITSDNKPVLQYVWGKIWVNNHAHVLQGKNISEEYLYFCLRNTDVKALITGAVQPKINQENMNKLRVIIPDRRTLTEVENKLSTIMKKYKENSNEINILIKIRDALLPKLMNGEIDLDKIEI